MAKKLDELVSITTPDDNSEVWVKDGTASPKDRRWSLTNLLAFLRGKFGTAVDSDVQTSLTDTTADRLMKVGAFGLGGIFETVPDWDAHDKNTPTSLIYNTSTATDNNPFGNWLALISLKRTTDRVAFIGASTFGYPSAQIGFYDGSTTQVADLLDSGNYPSDTAWTTTTSLDNGWTGTIRYIKRAGMVTINLDTLDNTSETSNTLLTLPAAYRPNHNIGGLLLNTTNNDIHRLAIITSGDIDVFGVSNTDIRGSITYPVV